MKNLFYKYFQGSTSHEEEKQLMDYVQSSEEAMQEFLYERKIWDAYLFHAKQTVHTQTGKINPFRKLVPLLHHLPKVAAVFIGVFMLSFAAWYYFSPDKVELLSIYAADGEQTEFVLPDGTKVYLNENTTLRYPAAFRKDTRNVELFGEAFFEVVKGEAPFIVQSARCNIKVLGTVFNVRDYGGAILSTVSLFEGSVKVEVNNSEKSEILLSPNEQLTFNEQMLEKGSIENPNDFIWRKGVIAFDDIPFHEMIGTLERYYDVKLIVTNPRILEHKCTAKFRRSEGIDQLLKVLQKNMNFDYHYTDNKTIIIEATHP